MCRRKMLYILKYKYRFEDILCGYFKKTYIENVKKKST